MLRPLFIDNDYQILNSASGQIARNFWEHQSADEFCPTIICTPAGFDFKSRWETIEIPDHVWIRQIGGALQRIGLSGLTMMPDRNYYSWTKFVLKMIPQIIREYKFDYIHTLCAPRSTNYIGIELKKRTGKPWIAQFNDPWVDNPNIVEQSNVVGKYNLKKEREVAEYADVIIHTNHVIRDIWIERYGDIVRNKMYVVPLNFNIHPLPAKDNKDEKGSVHRIEIAHLGSIYSSRSSLDFLKGMSLLLGKHPEFKDRIHVTFVGGIKKEEEGAAEKYGLGDIVDYLPLTAPELLDSYYSKANIYLALDVNINNSPCFPSKLMMYYYYGKPILGITNPNSIMDKEMRESGNVACYYGHPEHVADYLYKAFTDFDSLNSCKKDYWEKYKVENVSSEYKVLLNKIGLL